MILKIIIRQAKRKITAIGQEARGTVAILIAISICIGWAVGAAIAACILYSAWLIVREALDMLMDREMPEGDRDTIREIAMAHPEVASVHDLRTRRSGPSSFIQFHLVMNAELTLLKAHVISDVVEMEIRDAFPEAEVLIHQDPTGIIEKHAFYRP